MKIDTFLGSIFSRKMFDFDSILARFGDHFGHPWDSKTDTLSFNGARWTLGGCQGVIFTDFGSFWSWFGGTFLKIFAPTFPIPCDLAYIML